MNIDEWKIIMIYCKVGRSCSAEDQLSECLRRCVTNSSIVYWTQEKEKQNLQIFFDKYEIWSMWGIYYIYIHIGLSHVILWTTCVLFGRHPLRSWMSDKNQT